MASRTRHLDLTLVVAALLLICALSATLASSRAAVRGAGPTRSVTASTEPLACDSDSTSACFDITTDGDGANITHVFVDAGCAASPSDFEITVDGVPVTELHTDDGPCESIPRDVWFPLPGNQDTAEVCVSVQAAGPEDIQVYAKAGDECIVGTVL
jgi:archaellum component FlaG (FlaF/FlaG flagellin family)